MYNNRYINKDILFHSLSLSHTHTHTFHSLNLNFRVIDIRSEWHKFINEKSATDQSHVGAVVILYYLCHSISSQILNYQNP